ncbi:MAG TPA: hypothetical protein VKE69_04035, partial [Planctomycetota bacterium]|nr:hypothetical protein [Planctomycetota bacterium]
RHASRDELNPGFAKVELRFELPRGSYATLVVKRLFTPHDIPRPMRERRPDLRVSGAQPPLHAERPRRDRPAPVARAPRSGPRPFPRSSGLDGPRRFPPRPGAPRRPFGDGPRARRPFAPRPPRPPRLPRPDERPPDPPKEPDEKNG